jgi:hypothetical protein
MKRALLVVAVLAACRAGKPAETPQPGMSYEAYMTRAAELERQAAHEDQSAEVARQQGTQYQCDTHPESEQTTSGGERLQGTRICDDVSAADRRRHEARAKELREAADHQRGLARSLLDADRAACDGIPFDRLRDPPLRRLAARAEVADVEGGARITLTGDDLDADDLRRELGCHHARAALGGFDPAYMPSEPTTVAGSQFRVERSGAAVIVTVQAGDTDAIDLVRRRAAALVGR